ncbi:unnamed protein product [Candidula unifasciata]|uniref:Fibronectin type-III domain-containing protein n=1 Tax=Candidula unifasciata TaxID=100452 RepID=A0A8S3ZKS8_9EUPU|nr:unnamed protein product [Candidula unifasciata]
MLQRLSQYSRYGYVILLSCILYVPVKAATPPYFTDNQSVDISKEYHNVPQFDHFNEPYDQRVFDKLNIDIVTVEPWSIHVKWRLTNLTHFDSVVESTFLCETLNGKIVSDKLHSNTDSFNFQMLHPNTKYVICVHLLEKSRSTNTSILHYNCQTFSTIPVIRSDSIVGLALTIGYLLLVAALGYLAWHRRARKIKSIEEEKLHAEENEGDRQDDYFQFLKTAERGGIPNYASEDARRMDMYGANGGEDFKAKPKRADCVGACVPFDEKEEEDLVEYNPTKREISF